MHSSIYPQLQVYRERKVVAKFWRWVQIIFYTIITTCTILAFIYTEVYNHTNSLESIKWNQAEEAFASMQASHADFDQKHPLIVIK